jgi:hypothetical protein
VAPIGELVQGRGGHVRRQLHVMPTAWQALAALGLLLTACGPLGNDGPALTSPGANSVVEGTARIHRADTVTIGSMFGCLDESGSIMIDNIEPVDPIGLEVTGWGLRPNPFWKGGPPSPPNPAGIGGQIGVAKARLSRLGFTADHHIDVKCGKHGEGYEFAVQVEKTTAGEAGASGWVVAYTTDGKTKLFGFPIAVKLCNEKVSWSKACRALKV